MKNQSHSLSVLLVDPVARQDLHIAKILSDIDAVVSKRITDSSDIKAKLENFDTTPVILVHLPGDDTDHWLNAGKEILDDHKVPLVFIADSINKNLFNKINQVTPYGYIPANCDPYRLHQTLKTAHRLFEQTITQKSDSLADQELNVLATTFSKVAGQKLFDEVCRHLVDTLNLDYAFIGELVGDNQISVYSIYGEGEFKDPFNYSLEGTPCANVTGREICCIKSEVSKIYPEDELLTEIEIEGYVGIPLFSSSQEPLGIAVLLNKDPLEDPERCQQFLQIYSDRVSTEMERIQAEKALRERKRALSSINKNITEGIYRSTPNDGLVYINQAFANMFGYERQELIDLEGPEMYADEERREELRIIEDEQGHIKNEEVKFKRKDGSTFWALMSGTIVYDDRGEVKYYDGSVLDISERKKTQEENRRLLEAIQQSPVSIIITDTQGNIQYVNPRFENKSSESKENIIEIIALTMDQQSRPDSIYGEIWQTIQKGQVWKGILKTSEEIWEEATISPVFDEDDEITNFITICEDITQRKKHEEQLEQSIKEKEVLLAEIHHRVKNNLAVISGLLELQKFKTSDPLLQNVLKNTSNRIQSIANVHELLYRTEDFSKIDLQTQIEKLCQEISNSYHQKSQTITFDIDAQDVQLNANQAITFGLLLNELINNSFKHAFPDVKNNGTISITLSQDNENIYLSYSDDGVGVSELSPDDESTDSLGFTLINTLAKQLEALKTEFKNKNGFSFELVFEKIEDAQIGSMINDHLGRQQP